MRTENGQPVYLADYKAPAFKVHEIMLDIRLDPEQTVVISTMRIERLKSGNQPLILDGDELSLDFVSIDGRDLPINAYSVTQEELTIPTIPDGSFELQITTRINPTANTKLTGLYLSSDTYCTQCEAEGFRRITYFLDRPDILTTYTTRIEGPLRETRLLLSNGNLLEQGRIDGTDRHYAIWHDPYPKPSYLFALVAGQLDCVTDHFTTVSGRKVKLEIYVEPGKTPLCDWAMASLKRCMKWDEEVFGREYDLDIFMIVAVSNFNMGAMENKGLNIFNDKYVLADNDTATDADFVNIEAIIAHEYFHNWTGNRITCRDWFQLCLKEGLTVFRDQEFTSDIRSRPVKRINDVRLLRSRQFPEDASPLAHAVRPDAYSEINNFYTATVYEKGAELVRMIKTIIGEKGFADGIALYFTRYDGQAATIENFLSCFEEVNEYDLSQFKTWYDQAGTPHLFAETAYDKTRRRLTLNITQKTPATPNQPVKAPLHIPVKFGLVGQDGADMKAESISGVTARDDVLHLTNTHHQITLEGIPEKPVVSLLRGFSAPINLDFDLSLKELVHLANCDNDTFNRWQSLQTIATRLLLEKTAAIRTGKMMSEAYDCFYASIEKTISDEKLDPSFKAQFLTFPTDMDLAQQIRTNINPTIISEATGWLKQQISQKLSATLEEVYEHCRSRKPYKPSAEQIGVRQLKNAALALLSTDMTRRPVRAEKQYDGAKNLTDRLAALSALVLNNHEIAAARLADFDRRYRHNLLVMDKWFAIQAIAPHEETLGRVKGLMRHPSFSITNPNRIQALIGNFANSNLPQFNRLDGKGYQFVAHFIIDLDKTNPQVAARLLTSFRSWTMLEPERRKQVQNALKLISNSAGLSTDLRDIVNRTLSR